MSVQLPNPLRFRADLDAWRELEDASRALDSATAHLDGDEAREVFQLLEDVDRVRALVEARLFTELDLDPRPPFGQAGGI